MKRVLYLTYDGLTDPLGQSQVLPYLLGLSKIYSITIVSFEKKAFANNITALRDHVNSHNIEWHSYTYTKKPPILSTMYDLLRLKSLAFKLHEEQDFQIVHCRSYLTSLIGLLLKRKKNVRFIFDMRGFWVDERIDGNIWTLKNPIYKVIYRFFKKKEKDFLSESNYVISLTHAGKKIIEQDLVQSKDLRIKIIPCCVDSQLSKE